MNRIGSFAGAVLIAFIILAGGVSAQQFTVTTVKPSYGPGETVGLSTTITNDAAAPRILVLEVNIRGIDFPLPPAPLRVPVALSSRERKTLTISPLTVDDGTPPGSYQADVSFYDGETLLSVSTVSFTITGTKKPLPPLELRACTDTACTERTSFFDTGSTVYLQYVTVVPGMTVTATVQGSGGTITSLTLPGQFITHDKGIYVVSATATKDGYAPQQGRLEFSVLDTPVTLIESRGIPVAKKPWPMFSPWLIGGVVAITLAGICAIVWMRKKRREKKG